MNDGLREWCFHTMDETNNDTKHYWMNSAMM